MPLDEYCLILFSHPLLPEVVPEFQFNEVNVHNLKFSCSLIHSTEFDYKEEEGQQYRVGTIIGKKKFAFSHLQQFSEQRKKFCSNTN